MMIGASFSFMQTKYIIQDQHFVGGFSSNTGPFIIGHTMFPASVKLLL